MINIGLRVNVLLLEPNYRTVLHKKIGLTMMNIRKFNRTKKGEYAKMELKVISELVY